SKHDTRFSDAVIYLSTFDSGKDFYEKNLTILEQKAVYKKLHGVYKKALNKALQNSLKSQQLISLLQKFVEQSDSDEDLQINTNSDQDKNSVKSQLQNLKMYY
ncbi:15126_t:CDS:1, partial [Racocetra fulgida]